MAKDESRKAKIILFAKFGTALVLWLLLSWVVADFTVESQSREMIQAESNALDKLINNTAQSIDLGLDYLHGIPALVAKEELISGALASFGSTHPSPLSVEKRKTVWSSNAQLKNADRYLDQVRSSLGADVVWIINAAGDCIASSNSQKSESFVGTNYADRDYFRIARNGKPGRQYAMGRKTNIPGLYFSVPITIGGHFAGVAVAKIDLSKLYHWVSQTDSFISDEHGVIILARDQTLEMRTLPATDIMQLSEADRMARYKLAVFSPLAVTAWDEHRFPSLRHFDSDKTPLLIASKSITDEGLDIYAFKRLPAIADFELEQLKLFLLIGASGTMMLLVIAGNLIVIRIRKHSDMHAAKSASLLRSAIEATADGILVVDSERRVTTYNQRFVEIWHIPPELVTSDRDEEVLESAADQAANRKEFLGKVLYLYKHPELTSFDMLRLKDGTDIERYSYPQRLGDRIVGRVWSFRDVTKRKLAEKALLESRDELEQKVRERTADLQSVNLALRAKEASQEELIKQLAEAHHQLLQSEKMASIGQLAAGVAHEINNPVGYVNSNLTTLQQYVADLLVVLNAYEQSENEITKTTRAELTCLKNKIDIAFMREDINKLISESISGLQRVKRIVQDLKDFSHVGESAKLWSNIEQGMDSTLNVVWNELKYKAEVVKEYGGIPEIECIPTQINQVFMNLLMNAAQAIEVHGKITIRTGQEGDFVWVEVEDTGAGVDPKNLNRIFDPFFTTKPVGKGTGLGLSLSYSIVQKHGGQIMVCSEPGKGTIFRVMLPRQSGDKADGSGKEAGPEVKQNEI